ncbi:hypothetical protein E1301_Tti024349 [Triplophysa tibetana]|uniref:Uncharacterized protein n=1 Tax=Triplophysa tibetana TaxID=1572043 RepID=A0A5A9MWY8_9TELE|nr:hypothetical protein E1301_Tti024349 [Triplophysa tibetana]
MSAVPRFSSPVRLWLNVFRNRCDDHISARPPLMIISVMSSVVMATLIRVFGDAFSQSTSYLGVKCDAKMATIGSTLGFIFSTPLNLIDV